MSMLVDMISGVGNILFFLLAFLLVLIVVVLIHELGHFIVARWCGVKVSTFSIGFGREICGFTDRHGTRWRLAWIPLGGYVKFIDDANPASAQASSGLKMMNDEELAGSFHAKPVWQRAAVVAAGPIANFLLAIVIFSIMFTIFGVVKREPRISAVMPDTPAAAAGFKAGDLVLSIDGHKVEGFSEIQQYVTTSPGRNLQFMVERDGSEIALTVKPVFKESVDRIAGKHQRPVIGIQSSSDASKISYRDVNPIEAVGLGVHSTWTIITQTLSYISDVVMQRQPANQIGGVIRIADASGKVAQLGPGYIVSFIAFISVSIGLINLFPIPLLDGGHLLFYAIEALRGRPLSEKTQEFGFKIGLAFVTALMLFATWNDLAVVESWFEQPPVENQTE